MTLALLACSYLAEMLYAHLQALQSCTISQNACTATKAS